MDRSKIRNFCIIAHIDHGKSTLADRILQFTGAIDSRKFRDQVLDDMDLERERGITIKASAVNLNYKAKDGQDYELNLIDTPGHVDFTYEVTKALTACEGALLVVDATQGIEAQTVANFYLAKEKNLAIIPVINKIDVSSADVERTTQQLEEILKFKADEIILASAKEGIGIEEILEKVITSVPAPKGDSSKPLKALIFDSTFDVYRGVVIYFRIIDGQINEHQKILTMQTKNQYEVEEVGVFTPLAQKVKGLSAGEVGYITAGIRESQRITIGDTLTSVDNPALEALPGYKKLKPLVFCGIYPVNASDFPDLREAMDKLRLNDSSFVYEPETSQSFGYGFRCGFLGLLHMEIVQERLEREYNLNLILTTPNVVYRVRLRNDQTIEIDNPAKMPEPHDIASFEEPYIKAFIIVPVESMEQTINFVKERRGIYKSTEFLYDRVRLNFSIPLAEVIVDFYDKIKSITRGYGSLDYEFEGYVSSKIVKLEIMINQKICDAFSWLIYKDKAQEKGRALVEKLKELIPRQLFEVSIQASIGSQIIASEKVRPVGKHMTAKCSGGDITRKRKLWDIQKRGKRRLKQFGAVEIPQEAFLEVLKI